MRLSFVRLHNPLHMDWLSGLLVLETLGYSNFLLYLDHRSFLDKKYAYCLTRDFLTAFICGWWGVWGLLLWKTVKMSNK